MVCCEADRPDDGHPKAFPGVSALDRVDFDAVPGEILALAGENGSGKSTLVKILYGALQADAGRIVIDGEPVSFAGPPRRARAGIVAISQELTLAPTLTVAENVLLGRLRAAVAASTGAPHRRPARSSTRSTCTSIPR